MEAPFLIFSFSLSVVALQLSAHAVFLLAMSTPILHSKE
jgi:hypothetical protein